MKWREQNKSKALISYVISSECYLLPYCCCCCMSCLCVFCFNLRYFVCSGLLCRLNSLGPYSKHVNFYIFVSDMVSWDSPTKGYWNVYEYWVCVACGHCLPSLFSLFSVKSIDTNNNEHGPYIEQWCDNSCMFSLFFGRHGDSRKENELELHSTFNTDCLACDALSANANITINFLSIPVFSFALLVLRLELCICQLEHTDGSSISSRNHLNLSHLECNLVANDFWLDS